MTCCVYKLYFTVDMGIYHITAYAIAKLRLTAMAVIFCGTRVHFISVVVTLVDKIIHFTTVFELHF